jgi:hypothetical protein
MGHVLPQKAESNRSYSTGEDDFCVSSFICEIEIAQGTEHLDGGREESAEMKTITPFDIACDMSVAVVRDNCETTFIS